MKVHKSMVCAPSFADRLMVFLDDINGLVGLAWVDECRVAVEDAYGG